MIVREGSDVTVMEWRDVGAGEWRDVGAGARMEETKVRIEYSAGEGVCKVVSKRRGGGEGSGGEEGKMRQEAGWQRGRADDRTRKENGVVPVVYKSRRRLQ